MNIDSYCRLLLVSGREREREKWNEMKLGKGGDRQLSNLIYVFFYILSPNSYDRWACLLFGNFQKDVSNIFPSPTWVWDWLVLFTCSHLTLRLLDRRNSNAKPLAQDVHLGPALLIALCRGRTFFFGDTKWDFQSGGKIQTHSTSNSNIFKTSGRLAVALWEVFGPWLLLFHAQVVSTRANRQEVWRRLRPWFGLLGEWPADLFPWLS